MARNRVPMERVNAMRARATSALRSLAMLAALAALPALHCKSRTTDPPTPTATAATTRASATAPPLPSGVRDASAPEDASAAPDAARRLPEGTLTAAAPRATSFCTLYGTYPEDAKASAEAGRQKLAKAGVEDVAVRETSEFTELAWGQLVVVSVANTRAEADARSSKANLGQKPFVRPCSEVSGSFAPSAEPIGKGLNGNASGCLGWNPAKKSAVCILEEGSLQQGREATVTFLGSATEKAFTWLKTPALTFDAKVDAKTVARLGEALRKGGYQSFADYRVREIQPGEEAPWGTPKFSIRYERRDKGDEVTVAGSWNDVHDTVSIDCKGDKTTLFESDLQGVVSQPLRMYWSPKNALLLVSWDTTFAREGDNGGFTGA